MKHSALVKDKSQNNICFTIFMVLMWSDTILLRFARVVLMKIPYIWTHVDMLISLAFALFLCLSFLSIYRVLCIRELFITLVFYGVFFLHYYIFPLNENYYQLYRETVLKDVFPMFLIGVFAYRIEREKTLKVLNLISLATIFFYAGYMVLFRSVNSRTARSGDMNSAYMLLPHLCMVFYSMIQKANPWNVGAFAIGAVSLLFLGNRGSLLCLGVFVIFTILFSGRLKRPVLFLALSVIVMVVLFSFGLLDYLYDFAEENGFSLRIFEKLESGDIANSSGRDKISERVIEYIMLYPMMGMGIFSDRRVAGGIYAHNFFLEITLHYGVVLGMLIFAIILYIFIVAFLHMRKNDDNMAAGFFTSLVFACCFKLLLSNSYIMEPFFFFTIGYAYAGANEQRNMRLLRGTGNIRQRTLGRGEFYEG